MIWCFFEIHTVLIHMSNMKSSYYKFILLIILSFIGLWLLMFITSKDSTIQILLPWLETVKLSDRATVLSKYDSIETHQSKIIQDYDRNKTASSRNDSNVEHYYNSTNSGYDSDSGKRYGHFNRIQSIIRNPLIYQNKVCIILNQAHNLILRKKQCLKGNSCPNF